MKKKKRRMTRTMEAKLDTLRNEVGRVLGELARQLESTAVAVRDRLAQRVRPALAPWTGPASSGSTGPTRPTSISDAPDQQPSPAVDRSATLEGDTMPCPSTASGTQRGSSTPWIRFEAKAATEWGEEVLVVGNDPALGNWAPQSGLRLASSDHPTWWGQAQLAGTRFRLEYKYVRKNADGSFTWEAMSNNREFVVSAASVDRLMRDKVSWPS